MALCAYCHSTVFGGRRNGRLRFCNRQCLEKGQALVLADAIPDEAVRYAVETVQKGECPACLGPGPVDVHTSYTILSLLIPSFLRTNPRLCCRCCGRKGQVKDATFSFLVGWWSPHGFLLTPVQILRNVLSALRPPDPLYPSPKMVTLIKVQLASNHLETKSGGLTCPGCGAPYNQKDYRRDQEHIYCSGCKTELPKDAPEQCAAQAAAVVPAVAR